MTPQKLVPAGRVTLTLQEAANYCGLSIESFKKVLKKDEIPHRRAGIRYLFTKENLDQWLSGK